jgi:hypothetical protein
MTGYRFTPLSAAKSHGFLQKDAELIERYDAGQSVILLFKSDQEEIYQAVLSKKSGPLYRGIASTDIPFSSDEVQTVGGMSFEDKREAATLLSVVSQDEEVAYIEAGIEPDIERREVKKGERISFLFPFGVQLDHLYPMAFDKDGKELYYFGYPKGENILKSEDYKWHRTINGQ